VIDALPLWKLPVLTDLSMLKTDALSGIRTSFIGKLMEGSYRQCNLDSNAKGGSNSGFNTNAFCLIGILTTEQDLVSIKDERRSSAGG
jgi:hypothetical protein